MAEATHDIQTTEIATATETITAVMDVRLKTGEGYWGPLIVGHYTNDADVWIECEGQRINLPVDAIAPLIKQLRRAEKLARETKHAE